MRHINADKKRIKEILKENGYTMIPHSWFTGDSVNDVTFNTYDKYGDCCTWYINKSRKCALKQTLSGICVNQKRHADFYFTEIFEEV